MDSLITSAGFFGKLPGFADFVKLNSFGKEIQSIDTWIQEGISYAKLKNDSELKKYYNNASDIYFVSPFTGTENLLSGIISPASDKSGRTFPFIIFYLIKFASLNEIPYYLIPLAARDILFSYSDFIINNKTTEDFSGLKSAFERVKYPAFDINFLSRYNKIISEFTVRDFLGSELNDSLDLNEIFCKRLYFLDNLIYFHFDIDPDIPDNMITLCYSIQIISKILKNPVSNPGIFWTYNDNKPENLYLMFSRPKSKDFVDILFHKKYSAAPPENNHSLFKDISFIDSNTSMLSFADKIVNYLKTS